jgi:hypothetical protein
MGWLVGTALLINISLFLFTVAAPLQHLKMQAGGLAAFDTRLGGYDLSQARSLLEALGEEGREYYARVQLRIDNLHPATYALSHCLFILWLARAGRAASRGIAWSYRLILLVFPVAACALDWLENIGISAMLEGWPALSSDLVTRTSALTVAKFVTSTSTECAVIVLLLATLWRCLVQPWWSRVADRDRSFMTPHQEASAVAAVSGHSDERTHWQQKVITAVGLTVVGAVTLTWCSLLVRGAIWLIWQ